MASGVIQQYEGGILRDTGAIAGHEDCCCDRAPSVCPGGLANNYQISNYIPTLLSPCDACAVGTYDNYWDGLFVVYGSCSWVPGHFLAGTGMLIGNRRLAAAGGSPSSELFLDTAERRWVLRIVCSGPFGEKCVVWEGFKTDGATPEGTYSRDNGNDATASIDIEIGAELATFPIAEEDWGDDYDCRLADYTDGDITPAACCDASGGDAWDSINFQAPGYQSWGDLGLSIGKSVSGVKFNGSALLYTEAAQDFWTLSLRCLGATCVGDQNRMWRGRKRIGSTAAGTYWGTLLWSPSTLEVEIF